MMKNKIPCEIVQDLFPSYIDGLTSEVTNGTIEEHLTECDTCSRVLEAMKNPEAEPVDTESKKEIDFLRKTRKRTRRIILGSALAAAAIIAAVLIIRLYYIGNPINGSYVACKAEVDGNRLTLTGAMEGQWFAVSGADMEEESGTVTVSFKTVEKSPFKGRSFTEQWTYTFNREITEVRFDEWIVWSHGEDISAVTAAVYNSRHPYIGDMSANGRTAGALNMSSYLGGFKNELQTEKEPYGWKMISENNFSERRRVGMENTMQAYAYVLLAAIDNLGEVSYQYMIDGKVQELLVTKENADAFAGEDIKTVGQDINKLQRLMEETGLTAMSYAIRGTEQTPDTITVRVANMTEEEISRIGVSYFLNETVGGTQEVINADESLITKGQILDFTFIQYDFEGEIWQDENEITLKFMIYDKEGNAHAVETPVRITARFGGSYRYELSVDANGAFVIRAM